MTMNNACDVRALLYLCLYVCLSLTQAESGSLAGITGGLAWDYVVNRGLALLWLTDAVTTWRPGVMSTVYVL